MTRPVKLPERPDDWDVIAEHDQRLRRLEAACPRAIELSGALGGTAAALLPRRKNEWWFVGNHRQRIRALEAVVCADTLTGAFGGTAANAVARRVDLEAALAENLRRIRILEATPCCNPCPSDVPLDLTDLTAASGVFGPTFGGGVPLQVEPPTSYCRTLDKHFVAFQGDFAPFVNGDWYVGVLDGGAWSFTNLNALGSDEDAGTGLLDDDFEPGSPEAAGISDVILRTDGTNVWAVIRYTFSVANPWLCDYDDPCPFITADDTWHGNAGWRRTGVLVREYDGGAWAQEGSILPFTGQNSNSFGPGFTGRLAATASPNEPGILYVVWVEAGFLGDNHDQNNRPDNHSLSAFCPEVHDGSAHLCGTDNYYNQRMVAKSFGPAATFGETVVARSVRRYRTVMSGSAGTPAAFAPSYQDGDGGYGAWSMVADIAWQASPGFEDFGDSGLIIDVTDQILLQNDHGSPVMFIVPNLSSPRGDPARPPFPGGELQAYQINGDGTATLMQQMDAADVALTSSEAANADTVPELGAVSQTKWRDPLLAADIYYVSTQWSDITPTGNVAAFMRIPCDLSAPFTYLDGDPDASRGGFTTFGPLIIPERDNVWALQGGLGRTPSLTLAHYERRCVKDWFSERLAPGDSVTPPWNKSSSDQAVRVGDTIYYGSIFAPDQPDGVGKTHICRDCECCADF